MGIVAKFFSLPAADQWLFIKALVVVTVVRLRLALLPFRPGVGHAPARVVAPTTQPSPERIAWAVDRAGRYTGNATCLVRALAAQGILGRHGFCSRVSIGVAAGERQGKKSELIAHAWVEFGGRILLGGPDISRYTPLLTWST
jgi:hypothetical protein